MWRPCRMSSRRTAKKRLAFLQHCTYFDGTPLRSDEHTAAYIERTGRRTADCERIRRPSMAATSLASLAGFIKLRPSTARRACALQRRLLTRRKTALRGRVILTQTNPRRPAADSGRAWLPGRVPHCLRETKLVFFLLQFDFSGAER